MSTRRTFARSATALGAATALTVAGAGAATAADTTYAVDGNELSVTFEKEQFLDVAVCFAAVVPTAGAAGVVDKFQGAASGDVQALLDLISGNSGVTALKTSGGNSIPSVIAGNQTVSADLAPNVYTLLSKCTGSDAVIDPAVIVGNPLEAVMGSAEMGSSGDNLDAMFAVISSGLGGGADGGVLSSAIGGGDTGSAGE